MKLINHIHIHNCLQNLSLLLRIGGIILITGGTVEVKDRTIIIIYPENMRAPDCYPAGSKSPSIKEFLAKYQTATIKELEQAIKDRNHNFLISAMNEAWFYGPGQCGEAWNVLCDLCSECWVFED